MVRTTTEYNIPLFCLFTISINIVPIFAAPNACPHDHSTSLFFKPEGDKKYCISPFLLHGKSCSDCGIDFGVGFVPSYEKPAYYCENCPLKCSVYCCHTCFQTKTSSRHSRNRKVRNIESL